MVQAVACRAALYGFNSHPQLFSRSYCLSDLACFEGLKNSVNGLFVAVVVVGRMISRTTTSISSCQLPMLKGRLSFSCTLPLHFLNIRNSR
jgi:hypothetical protein